MIGGYTPSDRSFDALIIGYYENHRLLYAGRTRNGFTPALRLELMKLLRPLTEVHCPFANLPEKKNGRWGQGLTAAKMNDRIVIALQSLMESLKPDCLWALRRKGR